MLLGSSGGAAPSSRRSAGRPSRSEEPGVKDRRHDHDRLAARKGILSISALIGKEALGWFAGHPSEPRRSPRSSTAKRAFSARLGSDSSPAAINRSTVEATSSSCSRRRRHGDAADTVRSAVTPRHRRDLRPLAPRHLGRLGTGEHRVEVRALAPSFAAARVASMKPRWFRHVIPMPSPPSGSPSRRRRSGRRRRAAVDSSKLEPAALVNQRTSCG